MKKIFGLLTAGALALLAAACQRDDAGMNDPHSDKTGDRIELAGGVASRAAVDGYPFKLYALESGTSAWSGDALFFGDAAAFYNLTGNAITTDKLWPEDNRQLRFVGAMKSGDGGDEGVAASTVEITSGGLLRISAGEESGHDYLLSNNLTAGKDALSKEMQFRHVMTQLVVNLTLAADIGTATTVTGTIAAGKASGTYPLLAAEGHLAAGSGEAYNLAYEQSIENETPGEPTTITRIFYLVADGSAVSEMTGVKINGAGADNIPFMKGGVKTDIVLNPGASYDLTLNVNQRGIDAAKLDLLDWQEESLALSQPVASGSRMAVLWDEAGADVTSVEIAAPDGSVFAAGVTADPDVAGKGYIENITGISIVMDKVYAYHGDVRVEMTSPMSDAAPLWSYTAGSGDDPGTLTLLRVLVETAEQLRAIGIDNDGAGLVKHHYQVADIDLSATTWTPIGISDAKPFSGSYVGGGFKIDNFTNTASTDTFGIFGCNAGLLEDVHLAGGNVSVGMYSGGICGRNLAGGIVKDCLNEAAVTGYNSSVGGVVGLNDQGGMVAGCVNRGTVSMADSSVSKIYMGGVVGWNYNADVDKCVNYGLVTATDATNTGGVIGRSQGVADDVCTVSECANYGEIHIYNGSSGARNSIGGIVGESLLTDIRNSTHYGTVHVENGCYMGGIAGRNGTPTTKGGQIEECANRGKIIRTGTPADAYGAIGGIVGYLYKEPLTGCHNYGEVSGYSRVGGIVGHSNYSDIYGCHNYSAKVGGMRVVGGIVGYVMYDGKVYDCTNKADVYAELDCVGGIVGNMYLSSGDGHVRNCENTGRIVHSTANPSSANCAGGICGSSSAPVNYCVNRGTVTSVGSETGGIAGRMQNTMQDNVNYAAVTGRYYVGGIAGSMDAAPGYDTYVSGCLNSGKVTGTETYQAIGGVIVESSGGVGGLVGYISSGWVAGGGNSADVHGYWNVGGIVGNLNKGYISGVTNSAPVRGNKNVGGIVGYSHDSNAYVSGPKTIHISDCANSGKVTAFDNDNENIGGIAGFVSLVDVTNCRNTADVSGMLRVGGVVGRADYNRTDYWAKPYSVIDSSSNAGAVTGTGSTEETGYTTTGGIVGYNSGMITNCENGAAARVSGNGKNVGGIAGANAGVVTLSANYAAVTSNSDHVGGVVGYNDIVNRNSLRRTFVYNISVTDSSNAGDVTSSGDCVGGIAGYTRSSIFSSRNSGKVNGGGRVGGVVGQITDESLLSRDEQTEIRLLACYNTANVTGGGDVGGIFGKIYSTSYPGDAVDFLVEACYTAGRVYGSSNAGILAGNIEAGYNSYPVRVQHCYWGANPGAVDAVAASSTDNAAAVVSGNDAFANSWPADAPLLNWGVGNDAENGSFWSSHGTQGTTDYPTLWWE